MHVYDWLTQRLATKVEPDSTFSAGGLCVILLELPELVPPLRQHTSLIFSCKANVSLNAAKGTVGLWAKC